MEKPIPTIFYTVALETHETYGHGDSGKELRICKLGGYGTGDFPPLFLSREEAEKWRIAQPYFGARSEVVQLNLHSR